MSGTATEGRLSRIAEPLRFAVVGVANMLVDVGGYFLLTSSLIGLHSTLAKALSFMAGTLNSYYWNRRWTFRSTAQVKRTLPLFILTSLAALGINTGSMHLLTEILDWNRIISLLIASFLSFVWNFLAGRAILKR